MVKWAVAFHLGSSYHCQCLVTLLQGAPQVPHLHLQPIHPGARPCRALPGCCCPRVLLPRQTHYSPEVRQRRQAATAVLCPMNHSSPHLTRSPPSSRAASSQDIIRVRKAQGSLSDTVAQHMTTPAVTILKNTTVQEAADLMVSKRYRRLPVVDETGRCVG